MTERKRRWWLMVWPDDNARSVHNQDPKRKARDVMRVVEVVPAYELREAVDRADEAEAWVMRLYGMLSAGKKSMVLSDVQPVLVRARGEQRP